jgi:hypothetical protein
LLITQLNLATGASEWTHSLTVSTKPEKGTALIAAHAASSTNSFIFVAGMFGVTTFLRLSFSAGVVTASESYKDAINAELLVLDLLITNSNTLHSLMFPKDDRIKKAYIASLDFSARTVNY